jgi:hypothetical protein
MSRADRRSGETRTGDVQQQAGPGGRKTALGIPPNTVAADKEEASAPQPIADCSAKRQRLVDLLATDPPLHPVMLLVGAGIEGALASRLCKVHPPQRIREAVVHAARKSNRNPAGLIRRFLENPSWKGSSGDAVLNSTTLPHVLLPGEGTGGKTCPSRAMMATSDTVRRFRLPVRRGA